MSCGYACVGCGKCRGKPKELLTTALCLRCGHMNEVGATVCEECGMKLPRAAGSDRPLSVREDWTPSTQRESESN